MIPLEGLGEVFPQTLFGNYTSYERKVKMKENIYVKTSSTHGFGVFAKRNINKGEILEECPVIFLADREKYQHDDQIIRYAFRQAGCGCEECVTHGSRMFLLTGYGSLYNHSEKPNAFLEGSNTNDLEKTEVSETANRLQFIIASEDIEKDEEIFINYSGNSDALKNTDSE